MSIFFTYNDKTYKEGTAIITPDNPSLKYGDGLFETLKVRKGVIELREYHFERLFSGIKLLQFKLPAYFTAAYLENKISELCKKNQHNVFTRVRLMIFRSNGGISYSEDHPNYIIQTWDIKYENELNSNGLLIDAYTDARKSCDRFANIKSNNFLPYTMAALHAKKNNADDCVLLNNYDRICDTSIANIFIIKNGIIYTPPLREGCIAGVMRRFVIEKLQHPDFRIEETEISIKDLENADEVFLTNSIRGIRWVKQFRSKEYVNREIKKIYSFIQSKLSQEY